MPESWVRKLGRGDQGIEEDGHQLHGQVTTLGSQSHTHAGLQRRGEFVPGREAQKRGLDGG